MKMRYGMSVVLLCVMALLVGCSSTETPAGETIYNVDANKLALRGYDAVAYFTDGKPTKGKEEFKSTWSGAVWTFSSAANKESFDKEPSKYAPQYGGFCAWATAQGTKADADPTQWKVVDGKLYVNYDKSIHDKWLKDVLGFIKKGDENWPEVQKKPLQ